MDHKLYTAATFKIYDLSWPFNVWFPTNLMYTKNTWGFL